MCDVKTHRYNTYQDAKPSDSFSAYFFRYHKICYLLMVYIIIKCIRNILKTTKLRGNHILLQTYLLSAAILMQTMIVVIIALRRNT